MNKAEINELLKKAYTLTIKKGHLEEAQRKDSNNLLIIKKRICQRRAEISNAQQDIQKVILQYGEPQKK